MTVVTMVWVQKNVTCVGNATKSVLAYLAFRAHFDDGTASWPAVDTISHDLGIGRRTVQRAMDRLLEIGLIELGQQDFAGFNPKTGEPVRQDRRTTVWNVVCRDIPSEAVEEAEPAESSPAEVDAEDAGMSVADAVDDGVMEAPGTGSGQNDAPCVETERGDILSKKRDILSSKRDKMSPNIHRNTYKYISPSVPHGDISPSGGEPGDEGSVDGVAAVGGDLVGSFLDWFSSRRAELGLSRRAFSDRDRRAVASLLDRLTASGASDAVVEARRVCDHAFSDARLARRVSSPRQLARLFDEIRDAMTLDARSAPSAGTYGVPDDLEHRCRRLLDGLGVEDGNDGFMARRELRRLLREGVDEAEALRAALDAGLAYQARLDAERRDREAARSRPAASGAFRPSFAGNPMYRGAVS
ncbi:helix-turn-helix domain-containing protein [Bifidobacterium vansinderenii]|uniref:Zinc finger protein n=1 Tax=Bifidobacterium vansinderenii TaxID=1984871 RepID=A0A229VXL1_9BIFI|nr:helix-turn-helix domain-containing protein [Bifidobacterium vansinderenii]OXN00276.1 zinc finger protein [Bifidobacterium vansinderenii]